MQNGNMQIYAVICKEINMHHMHLYASKTYAVICIYMYKYAYICNKVNMHNMQK